MVAQLSQLCLQGMACRSFFALCGGHISPILIGAENEGIRVVDVRDEKNAVFAADAVGRLSGIPGVAAVTAGPGLTNTITAVKNAQLAQSPLIVFGGATATILRGRGSLQDIDQMSLMNPHVKWATSVGSVHDLVTVVERAFRIAREGVPGPVFIEVPVDLLYDEETVRGWYFKETGVDRAKDVGSKVLKLYLERHLNKVFKPGPHPEDNPVLDVRALDPDPEALEPVLSALSKCSKPVLVVGSQATLEPEEIEQLSSAVRKLGLPTYLGGMARGLLGKDDPLQLRHKRGKALKEADLVIVAGFPFDFRLGYGRSINKKQHSLLRIVARVISKRTDDQIMVSGATQGALSVRSLSNFQAHLRLGHHGSIPSKIEKPLETMRSNRWRAPLMSSSIRLLLYKRSKERWMMMPSWSWMVGTLWRPLRTLSNREPRSVGSIPGSSAP